MFGWFKQWFWRPSDEEIEQMVCDLIKQAQAKPGKRCTRHFGLHKSATVVFPK